MNHKNFAQTTLAAAIADTSGTSITVTSEASFPAVNFIISIDTEAMLVTNVAGTAWTVTRGYEGSTAATHLNGAAIYHDISAAEADAIATHVVGPSSATDGHLAVFDGATGKLVKDGGAVPPAGLPTTGGTLTGNLIMDNMDVTLVKLLTLHGEIDDGDSGTNKTVNWNLGIAHKSTLTDNVTFAFTGHGSTVVPTMTSATTPSGVVSSYSPGWEPYPAYKAFDGNDATFWFGGDENVFCWLQYQFTEPKTIIEYSIKNGPDYTWANFILSGSLNGVDWTTLDTQSGTLSKNGVYYYTISSPGAYSYYRLTKTVSKDFIEVATLDLADTATFNPSASCFLTLKLVQDGTGGRTVTWPATVKGTPAINLAANAVSNVLLYWDGTNYWVLNGRQFASATDKLIGRSTAGAGELEEIACTAAGRAILDDANAAAQLITLGAAAATTTPVISSGAAAPTTTPAKVGDIFVDTTGAKAYIAKGTSSSTDWVILN